MALQVAGTVAVEVIPADQGTSAALEDQDEDVTTDTVFKCGVDFWCKYV